MTNEPLLLGMETFPRLSTIIVMFWYLQYLHGSSLSRSVKLRKCIIKSHPCQHLHLKGLKHFHVQSQPEDTMRSLVHLRLQDLPFDPWLYVSNCTTGSSLEETESRITDPLTEAAHRGRSKDKQIRLYAGPGFHYGLRLLPAIEHILCVIYNPLEVDTNDCW